MTHVKAVKKQHPKKSLKEVLKMAAKTYKKSGTSKKSMTKKHKKGGMKTKKHRRKSRKGGRK
jgi:hypothetical protein